MSKFKPTRDAGSLLRILATCAGTFFGASAIARDEKNHIQAVGVCIDDTPPSQEKAEAMAVAVACAVSN